MIAILIADIASAIYLALYTDNIISVMLYSHYTGYFALFLI